MRKIVEGKLTTSLFAGAVAVAALAIPGEGRSAATPAAAQSVAADDSATTSSDSRAGNDPNPAPAAAKKPAAKKPAAKKSGAIKPAASETPKRSAEPPLDEEKDYVAPKIVQDKHGNWVPEDEVGMWDKDGNLVTDSDEPSNDPTGQSDSSDEPLEEEKGYVAPKIVQDKYGNWVPEDEVGMWDKDGNLVGHPDDSSSDPSDESDPPSEPLDEEKDYVAPKIVQDKYGNWVPEDEVGMWDKDGNLVGR